MVPQVKPKHTEYLQIGDEVSTALHSGKAVVALESTIIAHGMPFPENVETALAVEDAVRANGAIPATIAVIDGKLRAGLSMQEIELFGKKGPQIMKCSRRDIPYVVSNKHHGATTVASTMIIAEMAGIEIFGTGGIGGVHRGASETMDISADLQELASTNVSVVSAGAKAILDLQLTLEYLETYGVPVIGYGTSQFPAFYTRQSGHNVDFRFDSPDDVAQFIHTKRTLALRGGVLIANPIPVEFEMEFAPAQDAITQALEEAALQKIRGKAITPFLLQRITEITGGQSLASNVQLVLNNVRLAARIAEAYSELQQRSAD